MWSRAPTSRHRRSGGGPARPAPAPSPLAPGVSAVLDLQRAAGNGATASLLVPVQRQKKKAVGVAKYGSTKLTTRLQDMMQRGVLGVAGAPASLDRDQLFLLQGVANVETGGVDNAVYTRDNMYVSLGFKQVTLGWGSLYEIMEAAPAAFAKHGIVLGGGTYTLKAGTLPAVEGAPDPVALKTPPWTDRFFAAGAEDEVVSAMVAYTLKELGRMERRFAKDSPGRSNPWMQDPTARAWAAHPDLFGTKLQPSQPNFAQLSAEWMRLRDGVVRAAHSTSARQTAASTPPSTQPAPGTVPADVVAVESPPPRVAGASQAGSGDKYFAQGVGRYRDVADTGENAGKVRLWLYGSSGANVCNMTSLTMGLVSMAGEDEVRARMIGLLRTGMHAGAQVQVGGKFVDLAAALDDPRTSARIRTLDLVTAVAIGRHGSYKSVTDAGTIARVARDAGIATKAKEATGQIRFTAPAVRAKAAQMLADGTRVIVGTVNHYVYLTEVRDDGVVVHDPAGARVTPGLKGYLFVHAGNGAAIAAEFLKMDATRQATALRRATTNPAAAAVLGELPAVAGLKGAERTAALKQLAAAHPEYVETGRSNFYATSEFAENDLRLRVTLSAGS